VSIDQGGTASATLRDGFRVIGVAIRREPTVFTLSTLGSVLFGALTVADAWVLGWSTDHVLVPAFRTGEVPAGGLVAILARSSGSRCSGRWASSPAVSAPASCSTGCRRTTGAR
jgi:hypothetical protein